MRGTDSEATRARPPPARDARARRRDTRRPRCWRSPPRQASLDADALDSAIGVSHIVGAPEFINAGVRVLFPDGVPAATSFIGKRASHPPADAGDGGAPDRR